VIELAHNNISEIKGLETLSELRRINLRSNSISEIKGIDNLINLQEISFRKNPIKKKGIEEFKQYISKRGINPKIYYPIYYEPL